MAGHISVLTETAADLQRKLVSNSITSLQIVDAYLGQIKNHDSTLHAIIQVNPKARDIAQNLDRERQQGKMRRPLHGIPVLLKDNIATHPSIGLNTTAGSFALKGSVLKKNAQLVDQLIQAGAILLGKSNLSEFAGVKGTNIQPGWSAVGGQTPSAYVRGGLVPDGSILGHSSPGGSSTGSAVGVSAGYSPLAIGTETDGSIVTPANRAALYSMRPTRGLVSTHGILPASDLLDTTGPMAKSAEDLANLLDVMVDRSHAHAPKQKYTSALAKSWSGLRVGVLDPQTFFTPDVMLSDPESKAQMINEIRQAYAKIKPLVEAYHENISYITLADLEYEGSDILYQLLSNDFKSDLERYLADLETSEVRTVQNVIDFNIKNAEKELPPYAPNRSGLVDSITNGGKMSFEYRRRAVEWMRNAGGPQGIDFHLKKYKH